jgi:hypothetical protein
MNDAQTELFEPPRHSEDKDVAWLEKVLQVDGVWWLAADLLGLLGRPANEDGKRWIRKLAEQSLWIISGQRGYKYLTHATAEETKHCVNTLDSQGRKMMERAQGIRRNAHRVFA